MFIGLDLSLRGTGLVVINDKYIIITKTRFTVPQKEVERLFHLENKFLEYIDTFKKIALCCIESPAYGINEGRLFNLGQWAGIVELNLYKRGIPFIFAAPTQAKKYCTGKGKGDKDLMLLKTYQNFGEEFDNSDLADGYILARIAHDYYYKYMLNKELEVLKYQEEVLKKINKIEEEKNKSLLI